MPIFELLQCVVEVFDLFSVDALFTASVWCSAGSVDSGSDDVFEFLVVGGVRCDDAVAVESGFSEDSDAVGRVGGSDGVGVGFLQVSEDLFSGSK